MVISRGTTLAALVLAALAAPVTAFALSSGTDGHQAHPSTPAATHTVAPEADDETDETEGAEPQDAESGTPNPASAPGRAHAEAMKAWAHCVAEAASGPKTTTSPIPPKTACGDKPMAPGRAKHLATSDQAEKGDKPAKPKSHGHGRH